MSYIKKIRDSLAEKLRTLPEEEREELIAFVALEVLTSYKNGLRDADKNRPPRDGGERSSGHGRTGRPEPRQRRGYQQR